jgi:Glycine rich protein
MHSIRGRTHSRLARALAGVCPARMESRGQSVQRYGVVHCRVTFHEERTKRQRTMSGRPAGTKRRGGEPLERFVHLPEASKMGTLARYSLGISAGAALLSGCAGSAVNVIAPTAAGVRGALPTQHTFIYTGAEQSFRVPSGVYSITVVARGGAGGGSVYYQSLSGRGGRVYAVLPVHPGEKLYVFVGGSGGYSAGERSGGFNGGGDPGNCCYGAFGGGGASDVRQGDAKLIDRILVAGGGGGQGGFKGGGAGGFGGGFSGGPGMGYPDGPGGGGGGTQTRGGRGGKISKKYNKNYGRANPGNPGFLGGGGTGGRAGLGELSSSDGGAGGGGGGGYYGGGGGGGGSGGWGGGGGGAGAGGGGGSSYVEPSAKNARTWSRWHKAIGNGLIVFSWQ